MKKEATKCATCKIGFTDSPSAHRIFCSYACYWNDKKGKPSTLKGRPLSKSNMHVGFQRGNTLWKRRLITRQERYIHKGYVLIYSPEHPNRNNRGYVREHRMVMEKCLGRYLTKKEVVHHLNFDKTDNRIENLMLFSDNRAHMLYDTKIRFTK